MDEQTRERIRALLEELHRVEYHGEEYYRIVEELEALVASPPQERARTEPVEVIDLGEVTHYAFETEEAARLFREHAELLRVPVVDEALFDNAAQAEDGLWYVTVVGEYAQ